MNITKGRLVRFAPEEGKSRVALVVDVLEGERCNLIVYGQDPWDQRVVIAVHTYGDCGREARVISCMETYFPAVPPGKPGEALCWSWPVLEGKA